MANVNKVFLLGNLTRDPDVRSTPSGTSVCTLGLAVNRRYTTSQGEDREDTCFVDIETWGRQAENCGKYLSKGRPVLVEGRLRQDQWKDKNTGENRSKLVVHAENVQFLSSGQGDSPQSSSTGGNKRQHQSQAGGEDNTGNDKPIEMPDFEPVEDESTEDNIPF
ncbi:MAG: single-stranded DNA-binding protein [Verrucomicrobiota bacterium]